jgi:hypothetical protein
LLIGRYLTILLTWLGIGLFIFAAFMGWEWMWIFLITTFISAIIVTVIFIVIEFIAAIGRFKTDKIYYLILLIALDAIIIVGGRVPTISTQSVQQTQSAPQLNIPTLRDLMDQ